MAPPIRRTRMQKCYAVHTPDSSPRVLLADPTANVCIKTNDGPENHTAKGLG